MHNLIYQSWSDVRRNKTKFFLNIMSVSFVFGNLMIILAVVKFLWDKMNFCSLIIPIMNIQGTWFVGRIYFAKMNTELSIYKDGILIPVGLPSRKFIKLSEISIINLYEKEKKEYIEIVQNDGLKFIYPKVEFNDWNNFLEIIHSIGTEVNIKD